MLNWRTVPISLLCSTLFEGWCSQYGAKACSDKSVFSSWRGPYCVKILLPWSGTRAAGCLFCNCRRVVCVSGRAFRRRWMLQAALKASLPLRRGILATLHLYIRVQTRITSRVELYSFFSASKLEKTNIAAAPIWATATRRECFERDRRAFAFAQVPMSKVNWEARSAPEYVNNYKVRAATVG